MAWHVEKERRRAVSCNQSCECLSPSIMKNKERLRKIYYENRSINRNIQRLINIGLVALLSNADEKAKEKDNLLLKNLSRTGLVLAIVVEVLLTICDLSDYRELKMEEKLEEERAFRQISKK